MSMRQVLSFLVAPHAAWTFNQSFPKKGVPKNMETEPMREQAEESLLTLTDEDGNDETFEYLDCLEYAGTEYLILSPQEDPGQIVVLEIQPIDEENENYVAVEDDAVAQAVYDLFKEKYKDVLTFEED